MVLFVLYFKASLENVEIISFPENHTWCLDVRNPQSDWEVRERVTLSTDDVLDVSGSRGSFNFVVRWDGHKSQVAFFKKFSALKLFNF
jgi:hypothetical protein